MDTPYKVNWVFVTRYTQDQVRNEKIEEVNEHIEAFSYTHLRANETYLHLL